MRRILVTGGSGYLGRHLVPLASSGQAVEYTYLHHDPGHQGATGHRLDIRDETAVSRLVRACHPDVIVHTVGSNRGEDMEAVIRQGTRHIAQEAKAVGARLIHLSTDVIFDGRRAPYAESAAPSPIHAYGRAKADAEALVRALPDYAIVRTSLIYGLALMDHGTRWLERALRAGEAVTLFTDQYRNPVWVHALSLACLELGSLDFKGVLNVAGRQCMSRADFGLRMLDWWGIHKRPNLIVGPSGSQCWPANCELDLGLADKILSVPLPGVDEVLARPQRFSPRLAG